MPRNAPIAFSPAEIAALRSLRAEGLSFAQIVERMGYSPLVVRRHMKAIGIGSWQRRFSPDEDATIRQFYGRAPFPIWIDLLDNRTAPVVVSRARKLGLSKPRRRPSSRQSKPSDPGHIAPPP